MDNDTSADDASGSNKRDVAHAYDWLNDHGQPSYEDVLVLAEAGTEESIEQLHQLAEDNDVPYDGATDLTSLAQQVYAAIEAYPNAGVE